VSPESADLDETLDRYRAWLARQPLAAHSRRTYATRVAQFLAYLGATPSEYGDPLHEPHARDYAVRDFKSHLKTVRRAKPTSVNLALAAIDHFYRFLGLDRPAVDREDLPQEAPRALEPADQVRFLRAVERCPSVRDRALARLFFYSGLRLGEVAALDIDDVLLSARKGLVVVRSGKGDAYREVPLHREARAALDAWRCKVQRKMALGHIAWLGTCTTREGRRGAPGQRIRAPMAAGATAAVRGGAAAVTAPRLTGRRQMTGSGLASTVTTRACAPARAGARGAPAGSRAVPHRRHGSSCQARPSRLQLAAPCSVDQLEPPRGAVRRVPRDLRDTSRWEAATSGEDDRHWFQAASPATAAGYPACRSRCRSRSVLARP
jgi:site-specific recombinase XerC